MTRLSLNESRAVVDLAQFLYYFFPGSGYSKWKGHVSFFVMDGCDLTMVLSEDIGLLEFLRQRRRILAEEGLVVIPYQDLWQNP